MRALSYSEFSVNLAKNLNTVSEDNEVLIVTHAKGNSVVIMDSDEYNAIRETLYLVSTPANRGRLTEAMDEMNN